MYIIITKYTVDTWDCNCNDTWAVINGQSTKAIYSSRVVAATSGEIIRRRYTSFNNQLAEIILFNQEKIVV